MNDDLMRIPEAAEYLHMSKGSLAQLRYLKKGPKYTAPTPKTILYKKEWLDEWLVAGEVAAA
jgi:hypothetical protein